MMPTEIKSPITGTIWKIVKGKGDTVTEGEPIIIMESMKMEMPVESTVQGSVAEIRCAEGDTVDEGAVLAIVNEA